MWRRLPDSSRKKVCLNKVSGRLSGRGVGVGSDRARRGALKQGTLAESAGDMICKWHWGGGKH